MSKELVDLSMILHAETEKAVLVSETGDKDDAIWLPKSQCEIEFLNGNMVEITLPSWLAKDKELI